MSVKKNKIVIVTSYPLDDEPVVRNRLKAYFDVFTEDDWTVSIISLCFDHKKSAIQICDDGLIVKYVVVKKYSKKNFFVRAFFEIICSVKLLLEANKIESDYCLVSIPSMFLLLSSFVSIAPKKIVDVRDLVWEYIPEKNFFLKLVKYLLRFLAIFALRKSDYITISNPHELKYVRRVIHGVPPLLVSNGISREQFMKVRNIEYVKKSSAVLRISYIGNVGLAQNLQILVECVANNPDIHLSIVGSGTDFKNVEKKVSSLNAKNIELHGRVPWEKVLKIYANSDLLYTQLSVYYSSAMPSKLYEYLATGLPVLYGGTGSALEILKEFENVRVVVPDSVESLRDAIAEFDLNSEIKHSSHNINVIRKKYIREKYVESLSRKLKAGRDI